MSGFRFPEGTALLRIHPDRTAVSPAESYGALDLVALAPEHRPYLICNFAQTIDGRTAVGGRSAPIGSDLDTHMLAMLRTQGDAVMIGAGTLRAERYGRLVGRPEMRDRRERLGLAPDPVGVVISSSLDLPWDAGLFTSGEGEVVLITDSAAPVPTTETPVSTIRHSDGVDVAAAMAELRSSYGIRAVVCEGGPRATGSLIAAGCLDELFVTVAPRLAGGPSARLVEDLPEEVREAKLVSVLEFEGELYCRWRLDG